MIQTFLCRCLLLSLAAGPIHAQDGALQTWPELRQAAERHLQDLATRDDAALKARVEIGAIDPRLRLPRCAQPILFLPAGARLHGNGSLGVRCEDTPQPWTLYLSYKITLQGPALVARRPLAARQPLQAGDLELKEIAYAGPPGDYPRDAALLEGVMTARPIPAGQAITMDRLVRSQTVRAGQRVKLWLSGNGFVVTQEGVALNGARPGEPVRVRTDAGKLVQGLASADGRVLVQP
jgi:flagella basal body P-ring formation protein FlgA